ncbi:MAG: amidohydrolase family protein, partial [Clostridia bacterium]
LSSEDDLQVLADRGVSVANCPWIYTFRGGYLNSFSRYRQAGINMVLGTDTFPQEMLREMRWSSSMSKVAEQDSTSGRAEEIFDAVTVNAARYLGRDDLGKLSPGVKADVVMVDFDRFSIGPTEDPIRSLVYFATAADVRRVLVDGEIVVDDFKSTRVDEGEVVGNSQGVSNHVRDTLCRWMGKDSPQDEFPPPAYPRVR